jgi:hypothetical protein
MSQQEAIGEAVFFFDGDDVATELHYSEFEALLAGSATLQPFAASVARGAYVVVGTGLAVRAVVCFQLRFDEEGRADAKFSVPLRHLATQAGAGPDLGCGAIRLASRRQCSVSWHAMNLWEPEGSGEASPLKAIQRAAWRNRIGIKLAASDGVDPPVQIEPIESEPTKAPPPQPPAGPAPPRAAAAHPIPPRPAVVGPADRKIDQAFGDEGRVSLSQLIQQHNQNLEALTRKYRADLEQQQQVYLDQVRNCRDEIQRLKSLLRHEQNRNRRLQQLLRGDVGP